MRLTEAQFLLDLRDYPGGHARKPHYWLKRETRQIYTVVWKAWLRGYTTCPLFEMKITPAGRLASQPVPEHGGE